MADILIINGPNLNMLGTRQPDIYGHETLDDIKSLCEQEAEAQKCSVDFRQSNAEDELINWIQQAPKNHKAIIINAAAFTHTSVAIMDALLALDIPVIEVHLSNIYQREEFRHHSYISPAAYGIICGFGSIGYALAIRAMKARL